MLNWSSSLWLDYFAYKVNSFFNLANLQKKSFHYFIFVLVNQQNEHELNPGLKNLKLYQLLNILSIDVVIGSILSGAFVVRVLNVSPNWAWWIVLPMSVWVIYTLDHILDALKLKSNSHSLRHRFHYVYLKPLLFFLVFVTMIIIAIVILFLEKEIIIFGLLTVLISGSYLITVYILKDMKSNFLQKEIFVACIYTVGIWGGPISLSNNFHLSELLLMIVFFLTALIDILIFSLYELESDKLDNHNTFPLKYGQKLTIKMILLMSLIVFGICIYQFVVLPFGIQSAGFKIIMLTVFVLMILLSFREWFVQNNYYRIIGELVFWLPGLLLLY